MNAWLPQASYPCGNFSDTSSFKSRKAKGSIGHAFTVCIRTENQNQMSFYPFVLHEISVLVELILGHLRYLLTDVPPQPNSPPDNVFHLDRAEALRSRSRDRVPPPSNGISKTTLKVVVFHFCRSSHLFSLSPINRHCGRTQLALCAIVLIPKGSQRLCSSSLGLPLGRGRLYLKPIACN